MHFHEVGAVDAIGEVVGVALALEALNIDKVICSPLPMGRGFTNAAHGRLPLPAPATVSLLEGAPVHGVDVAAELVTPTGAALVASLSESFGPIPTMTLTGSGYGAGTRDLEAFPNVVRVMLGIDAASSSGVSLIEANLDDLLPELAPDAAQAVLRGRRARRLDHAGDDEARPPRLRPLRAGQARRRSAHVAEAMLRETSTLGVRIAHYDRIELQREHFTVEVAGEPVRDQGRKARRQGRQPRPRARGLRARRAHQRRAGEGRVGASAIAAAHA